MKKTVYAVPFALIASLAGCQGEAPTTQEQATVRSEPAPAVPAAPVIRRQETAFEMPSAAVKSVRIQPTGTNAGEVTFSRLVLVQDGQETQIDLCADRRLQLVRSRKVGKQPDGSCVIEFGNQSGAGWIAPSQLRNLPEAATGRQLQVAAAGELTSAFRVYFDVGSGYGSKNMVLADNETATVATGQ
jgi:hypothetical protein